MSQQRNIELARTVRRIGARLVMTECELEELEDCLRAFPPEVETIAEVHSALVDVMGLLRKLRTSHMVIEEFSRKVLKS